MNLFIKIVTILFSDVIIYLNGGLFKLKDKINQRKKGIIFLIFLKSYERKVYKMSSFIGYKATLGKNIVFPHGILGVFISNEAVIGDNAVIFQQVTIGSNMIPDHVKSGSPTIGKNCYIGAGAKIIGKVVIGDNVRIGANCVVTSDVKDNSVVVLDKPRIIEKENMDNRYFIKEDDEYFYYDNGIYKKV